MDYVGVGGTPGSTLVERRVFRAPAGWELAGAGWVGGLRLASGGGGAGCRGWFCR